MRNLAIQQAIFFPLGALLVLMFVGFTVPGYSSVSEHMSKLGLLGGYPAAFEQSVGVISGISIIIFSLALVRHPSGRFSSTVFTSILFGLNMLSNGIFPMGSPLHGLYGIGFFAVLTPVLFIAEMHQSKRPPTFFITSKLAAIVTLFYFWLMVTRLDPKGFQGLTQRLALIPTMGWYAYASFTLLRSYETTRVETPKTQYTVYE